VDSVQADFKGDNAKLIWAVSIDGKKMHRKTYRFWASWTAKGQLTSEATASVAVSAGGWGWAQSFKVHPLGAVTGGTGSQLFFFYPRTYVAGLSTMPSACGTGVIAFPSAAEAGFPFCGALRPPFGFAQAGS